MSVKGPGIDSKEDVQIFVKDFEGHVCTFDINPSTTMMELKKMVQKKTGTPAEKQRLIGNGSRDLENFREMTVMEQGVKKETTLNLTGRLASVQAPCHCPCHSYEFEDVGHARRCGSPKSNLITIPWRETIINMVKHPAESDDGTVNILIDGVGAMGKSYLARYLVENKMAESNVTNKSEETSVLVFDGIDLSGKMCTDLLTNRWGHVWIFANAIPTVRDSRLNFRYWYIDTRGCLSSYIPVAADCAKIYWRQRRRLNPGEKNCPMLPTHCRDGACSK